MQTISAACKAALRQSHTRTTVCEIYDGWGPMLASTYSTPRIKLDTDGAVTVDRNALHVRSFTATIVDRDGVLSPKIGQTKLDPLYRPHAQFYSEIGWIDAASDQRMTERIPIGRFLVDVNDVQEMGAGTVMALSGISAASGLIESNVWPGPYTVQQVSYSAAIAAAITDRASWTPQFRFESSSTIVPPGVVLGGSGSSDPWGDLQKLAEADGKELLDDALGAFILRTIPDPTLLDPTWSYDQQQPTLKLPNAHRVIDSSKVYNGVILNASAPWLIYPIQSVVWDTDPNSPTYYKGKFGMRPFQLDDAIVASQAQADAAAAAKLVKVLGVSEDISSDAIPNPAHEPGDVVFAASAQLGMSDRALLDTFVIPFDVRKSMPVTVTRQRHA